MHYFCSCLVFISSSRKIFHSSSAYNVCKKSHGKILTNSFIDLHLFIIFTNRSSTTIPGLYISKLLGMQFTEAEPKMYAIKVMVKKSPPPR